MTLRFSVRTKILSGFILIFILFLSVLIYCLVQMRQVQWQLSIVQRGYLPLTKVLAKIEGSQQAMERYLDPERLLTREQGPGNLYPSLALFHLSRMDESIQQSANLVELTRHMPGAGLEARSLDIIRGNIRTLEQEHRIYLASYRALIEQLSKGKSDNARNGLPQLRENMNRLSRTIRELSDLLDRRVEAAVELTRERQERAGYVVGTLSAAAIVFGLIMIFVTHLVLRPISRLIQGVQLIGRGDYQQRVAIEADDEIGKLAAEFNAMATSLEEREVSLQQSRRQLEDAYLSLSGTHNALEKLSRYNENILRSIEVGLLVVDPEERLTSFNPAAGQLWGLEPTARGKNIGELPVLSLMAQTPRRVLETGMQVRREALELTHIDGSVVENRLLDCTFVPLTGLDEAVQGVIILTEDVTERTRTRQRLIQSERLALIGRMGAQVTHEIRNPLNALGLNAELLEDELNALDPQKQTDGWQLLSSMRKEIDRLTDVTETYLRLARLPTPRLERLSVAEIVDSLLRFVREELSSRHITLVWQPDFSLPDAMVDENQLRQALLNIVRNAGEAVGEDGRIEVSVKEESPNGVRGLEILISDNGAGMDPGVRSRIFDPFYSTKASGNGLGLPITQQIIEEHGGKITCESNPGQGTTFRICLPAA